MSLLARVEACSRLDRSSVVPFLIDGVRYGLVGRSARRCLTAMGTPFMVQTGSNGDSEPAAIRLDTDPALPPADRVAMRSAALDRAVDRMLEEGILRRRRSEVYTVVNGWGETPVATVDRAAMTAFGFLAFGVHVNGYVGDGPDRKLWIARRSSDRAIAPGQLDNIVAGGIGDGHSIFETLIKESYEEAGLPAEIAGMARPTGTVSYVTHDTDGGDGTGVRRDVLFNYDLALPARVEPYNTDGEVADFSLMPVNQVIQRLETGDDFKFNVAPVMIDFLIRHGHIGPEHPDYQALMQGLHRPVDA
ncbi:DUF4743 domain-containing protein [Fodinicurvata sp. EGI_FJ10296]|uniref:NUDIX hydrolase n=1 Tax=Fodinicurvata sp. EGI_FJ10296 TaxID=3231908 RepID=UPI0034526BEF